MLCHSFSRANGFLTIFARMQMRVVHKKPWCELQLFLNYVYRFVNNKTISYFRNYTCLLLTVVWNQTSLHDCPFILYQCSLTIIDSWLNGQISINFTSKLCFCILQWWWSFPWIVYRGRSFRGTIVLLMS